MNALAERIRAIRMRIAHAAARSGRPPGAVRLVAAVKGQSPAVVAEAVACGLTDLGENRTSELAGHRSAVDGAVRWHYFGEVQTRKVPALAFCDVVHTLDRVREAEVLQRCGERCGKSWDTLIQVNVAGEASKQGVAPVEAAGLLDAVAGFERVRVRGLMIVAPAAHNPEDVRWVFAEARVLRDRLAVPGVEELSMGMSDDFEVAIEEGATMVRVGRAIFGERSPSAGAPLGGEV